MRNDDMRCARCNHTYRQHGAYGCRHPDCTRYGTTLPRVCVAFLVPDAWVVRVRASTGRGDPVACWLTKDAGATSNYAQAIRFASAAEAWDFTRMSGNAGGDEGGPWCEVVLDTREEAARQMDRDTLHKLDNPWLYDDRKDLA